MKENEEGGVETTMPTVSVIIPTYNRKDLLRETLHSLAQQTYPSDHFEVIVVDDGSTDGTVSIAAEVFPFILRYFWQSNQGDASARNLGARQSQADILVFLDDDILVEPDYLTYLICEHAEYQNRITVGVVNIRPEETTPLSLAINTSLAPNFNSVEMAFTDVFSNNMSIRREAYFKIGMMQGLDFPGSSMWCDLDFNYRAYQQGFQFCRSPNAICWHRDYTVSNLDTHKKRMRTAAYRAVVLFQKYPELLAHVPMFYDKTPIIWEQDPPRLITRKLVRSMTSSRPALWSMEQLASTLEKRYPTSPTLRLLYRYIIGGYIFQGYREGLNEFGRINNLGDLR
ncbi:MAG: glycosyltransferase family 2 protein [Chloroflexota bacterium]|nr:glycosyltransferase family 2 protein [Chloroflexota bacterium]